jgi:dihydroorotate dehydrogenase
VNLYHQLLRPFFFILPAEAAHNLAILSLRLTPPSLLRAAFGTTPQKPTKLFGLTFPNPVGLAAGMDKNASALRAWESLGFGFIEAGTSQPLPNLGTPSLAVFDIPPSRP